MAALSKRDIKAIRDAYLFMKDALENGYNPERDNDEWPSSRVRAVAVDLTFIVMDKGGSRS